jgi:hypothetical protein
MSGKLNKVLVGYSAVLTTLMAGAFVTQAVSGPAKTAFAEIDVQRINVREADGTLRMVISNTSKMPGVIYKGTNYPHPNRSTAGVLFFNEEGTENGGLSFGGRRDKDGKVVGSGGHLSFDQFEQDQVVALNQSEDGGLRRAGLTISDRPDNPMPFTEMGKLTSASPADQKVMVDKWVAGKAPGQRQPRLHRQDRRPLLDDGPERRRRPAAHRHAGQADRRGLDPVPGRRGQGGEDRQPYRLTAPPTDTLAASAIQGERSAPPAPPLASPRAAAPPR